MAAARRESSFWAQAGANLVEHVIQLDAAGAEEPAGTTNRYRLVGATPERLLYRDPASGEESEGVRVECPAELKE